jgi:hypothetical protein
VAPPPASLAQPPQARRGLRLARGAAGGKIAGMTETPQTPETEPTPVEPDVPPAEPTPTPDAPPEPDEGDGDETATEPEQAVPARY